MLANCVLKFFSDMDFFTPVARDSMKHFVQVVKKNQASQVN